MKNTDRGQSRGGKTMNCHEMRIANRMLILFLSMLLMLGGVPVRAADEANTPSPWAAEEIARALTLDFVPVELQQNCRVPITRAEFAELAVLFLQSQFNANPNAGYVGNEFINDYCKRHVNPDGSKLRPEDYPNGEWEGDSLYWYGTLRYTTFFSDVPSQDEYCNFAHAFGIVNGRGDGIFDPDGAITRQEAAAMLMRTYTCYAGPPEAEDGASPFPDTARIAGWAQDSVRQLNLWGVMQGTDSGAFDPEGTYTREQSIVTFLRLYEKAPISRAKGNVTPLVPYDEELERQMAGGSWILIDARGSVWSEHFEEGETCAVMVLHYSGALFVPGPDAIVVYRDGGYRSVPPPLNGAIVGGSFHEDETVYSFQVRHADGYEEVLELDLVRGVFLKPEIVRESVQNPAGIIAEGISVPDVVLAQAVDYVARDYAHHCVSTGAFGMVDGEWVMLGTPAAYDNWRIEGLEMVHSYRELDGQPLSEFGVSGQSIDIYQLDYRIHTLTPGLVIIAGGMDLDTEGWLLPGYPHSIYLCFAVMAGEPTHLFTIMANDTLPGNELFTNDLVNRLRQPEP